MDNERNYDQELNELVEAENEVEPVKKGGLGKVFVIGAAAIGLTVFGVKKVAGKIKAKEYQEEQDFIDSIEDSIAAEDEVVDNDSEVESK